MGTGNNSADLYADVLRHANGELNSPDIRVDQYRSKVIIRQRDNPSLELRLADQDHLWKRVMFFVNAVEEKRPLGLSVKRAAAQDFLSFAKEQAYHCLVDCTLDDIEKLQAARKVFTKHIGIKNASPRPPRVEICGYGAQYLPWEWLGSSDCPTDLEAEAMTFLGFAAVVYRRDIYLESPNDRSEFLTAQPLQVRFFRHPDLPSTEQELRFFKLPVFRLIGPLQEPGGALQEPGGGLTLAEQLADPLLSIPDGPDQIVHLSCHHKTDTDNDPRKVPAYDLALLTSSTLSFGNDERHEIKLADLAGAPEAVERPLVFFNGCRGEFPASVSAVLLRNSNRGVVSTSMKVPDDIAAEFGRFFYRRLLGGWRSAEALLCAKWDLLYTRGSPLGLLYTYHGQPALCVAPIVDIPPSWPPVGAIGHP